MSVPQDRPSRYKADDVTLNAWRAKENAVGRLGDIADDAISGGPLVRLKNNLDYHSERIIKPMTRFFNNTVAKITKKPIFRKLLKNVPKLDPKNAGNFVVDVLKGAGEHIVPLPPTITNIPQAIDYAITKILL